MAQAILVRTPTDFETTLNCHEFVQCPLCSPSDEVEPAFREALSTIFDELEYVGEGNRDLVRSYISSIEKPLRDVHALGFTILAVTTSGTYRYPNGQETKDWRRVHYLIVRQGAFFRIGSDANATVHRFDPDCNDAVTSLVLASAKETPIGVWVDRTELEGLLEGNVPWCINCC